MRDSVWAWLPTVTAKSFIPWLTYGSIRSADQESLNSNFIWKQGYLVDWSYQNPSNTSIPAVHLNAKVDDVVETVNSIQLA